MPNTLAHLGVQLPASRWLARGIGAEWIALGCVIPDLPWILQRAVASLAPAVDRYDLRLYASVQSSLAVCLLLCAALALSARRPVRLFALLAANCALHLALDAVQIKWANGVLPFVPLSFALQSWGWFWPESPATLLLTALGLLAVAMAWRRPRSAGRAWCLPRPRAACAAGLCLAWLLLPLAGMSAAEAADVHFVGTLRQREARDGRRVEFDRRPVRAAPGGPVLVTFTGESLRLTGAAPAPGRVSLRGRFADPGTVVVESSHRHLGRARDLASYAGLALVAALWWRRRPRLRRAASPSPSTPE